MQRKYKLCIIAGIVALFVSCNQKTSKEQAQETMENNLPAFVVNPEMENPDFYFRILSISENDSSYVCLLKSLHKKDSLGMELEVMKWLEPGLNEDGSSNQEQGFSQGKMRFKSLGNISDNFIAALSEQYKMPTKIGMKSAVLEPLVFSSNKERVSFQNNKIYSFKIFLKNSIGEEAEVFALIDLHRRLFEFKAKDASYFSRIIDGLQQ